jgi:ribosomal protein S18 acetylase RimI-like enzyme
VSTPHRPTVREDQPMLIRPLSEDDQDWKERSLTRMWGSCSVARRGELVDAGRLPGLAAIVHEHPIGLLTYDRWGDELEVVSLHVEHEGYGAGRALMDGVLEAARREDGRRLWLMTTNDNIRAISFYQQWGMNLVACHRDAVAASRERKPSIATIGSHGIPVRHELEFELRLDEGPA